MSAFCLESESGLRLEGLTLGATLTSLTLPLAEGRRELLLGCRPQDYPRQQVWLGAVAGRFANRIGGAELRREGQCWPLDANQPPHCLHGGSGGFHRREWTLVEQASDRVVLALCSVDGDQGFPGNLEVTLCYRLAGNDLLIEFDASTDRPTPVSLTSHAYFNLDGGSDVRAHRLTLRAERFLPTTPDGIPLSAAVVEGVFDLRHERRLAADWGSHPLQRQARGYDHAFVLTPSETQWVARLVSGDGRVTMEMHTDQPSVQLYTGNWLAGTPDRRGGVHEDYAGVCLEAQQLPDSPNRPELGDPWLLPGEHYRHRTRYRFLGT
ncbi:galactose-1-epimerase [Aeromonas simiae]|uniref:galactose-1-epimerase n=1 Tax=Aeromonas simiae TaxID=218936 RepID=UPI00266C9E6A|nr:galactose-1-epimerase [Aeromonas simiae]MDO2949140.1 galactose-1-epimerase [Aeromonas simiae]MDO2952657.1 galactose-1-epimerase [Aeromonas simiae]MDO2956358.1 galactose-1-epimerase [Aeromonas simiae]